MKMITLENIDELTGDILSVVLPDLNEDSDKHDAKYTELHNFLKEALDPWREEEKALDIQVQRMYRFETDRPLKAFVDVIINDALLIKGVRIMDSKDGLFVSMPREQAKDSKWYDTIRCLTMDIRDKITVACLSAYTEGIQ